jgi:hypothetical protein
MSRSDRGRARRVGLLDWFTSKLQIIPWLSDLDLVKYIKCLSVVKRTELPNQLRLVTIEFPIKLKFWREPRFESIMHNL